MPRTTNEVHQKLCSKFGFELDSSREAGHRWYVLQLPDLPPIRTKLSHGHKSLSDVIEGKIAKQLRVRRPFYDQMMSCTKDRDDYIRQVKENPFPPW